MASDKTPKSNENRRVRRVGDGVRAAFEVVRGPFEDVRWALRKKLLWPAQDRFDKLDGRGRALATGGGLAVVAIVVIGLVLATSGGSSSSTPSPVAVAPKPVVKAAPTPAPVPAPAEKAPTLHGATPVFKPAKRKPDDSKVGVGRALDRPAAQSSRSTATSSSAATDKISSDPTSSPTAGTSSTEQLAAIDGPPAGKAAIAVAHRFANAFVAFETGGEETLVRKAFAASATPALAKSLLKRPPRQPANVKVPQAKVLNVVAGPSHGGVYELSVSLLRVGVTSELRLQMENLKGEGWRVTNVLG